MARHYIEDSWQSFQRLVYPNGAPEDQLRQLRDAFFAGSALVWTIVTRGMSGGSEVEPDDLQLLDDVQQEVNEFGQRLDRKMFGLLVGKGGMA